MSAQLRRKRVREQRRRAVYLLPNLLTTGSLLLGFWSIIQSIAGNWVAAGWGIVAAGILDVMDGRVARATRTTSAFGVQYDSLADLVSFGVAPAVLIYQWGVLAPLGPRAWIVAALFMICAALRLARFNVQHSEETGAHYTGLPSTFAGGMLGVIVWFVSWLGLGPPFEAPVALGITLSSVCLALLMVSSVPYLSTKSLPISGRNGFTSLVALVLVIVILLLYRYPAFFALGAFYILSGPLLWAVRRGRGAPAAESSTAPGGSSDVE